MTEGRPRDAATPGRSAHDEGVALLNAGRAREAAAALRRAVRAAPGMAAAHAALGHALMAQGDIQGAVAALREAVRLAPEDATLHARLGVVLCNTGAYEEALDHLNRALALSPEDVDALVGKAVVLEHTGDLEGGFKSLEAAIALGATGYDAAYAFALLGPHFGRGDEAVDRIEAVLLGGALAPAQRKGLCFLAGGILDKLGRYDDAFRHYAAGNRLHPEPFDLDAFSAYVDRLIAAFSTEAMGRLPRAAVGSEVPVFIVGMPRSGTSLTEQILVAHPAVHGAGELATLARVAALVPATTGKRAPYPECVGLLGQGGVDALARRYLGEVRRLAPEAGRITDKMPQNFLHLGLIALLFPGARVLHCVRDAMDCCLSCYFQDFSTGHAYAFDLATLGRYFREYRRLMAHFEAVLGLHLMTVRYEDLVDETEATSRALVDFLGLPWDEACLRFHESDRTVRTASYDQVRRPVYRRSVRRWTRYEAHLEPLRRALGGLAEGGPGPD